MIRPDATSDVSRSRLSPVYLAQLSLFCLGIGLALFVAWNLRDPFFYKIRTPLFWGLVAGGLAIAGLALAALRLQDRAGASELSRTLRGLLRVSASSPLRVLLLAGGLAVAGIAGFVELQFRQIRAEVLAADDARLQRLGRHLVLGFEDEALVRDLARRGALGGIFLTARNARHRSAQDLRKFVDELQNLSRAAGAGPLLVASDQEGAHVSRLSPPLKRPPGLAALVEPALAGGEEDGPETETRRDGEALLARLPRNEIEALAQAKARDLRSVGVNWNFSPVADLKIERDLSFFDLYSRIQGRAVHRDPLVTAGAVDAYCAGLEAKRVLCTLKHFPGLGRVEEDTHFFAASLEADLALLLRTDWLPFQAAQSGMRSVMLGHVRLVAIDPRRPASLSRPVVELLRRDVAGQRALLVTDDLNMRPALAAGGGPGGAAVAALHAGVDLLLFSYEGETAYYALHALLQAEDRLDAAQLADSRARIARYAARFAGDAAPDAKD